MVAIGILLGFLGLCAAIFGLIQRHKSGRMANAPHVKSHDAATRGDQVASPRGAISVEGDVKVTQPLVSPVTGTPCLYYEVKVVGHWKDGDTQKSKDYYSEKKAADFAVDDGSGPVVIAADSGGDFELEKKFDQTKKEGFFADIKNLVGKKEPIVFGNFHFDNPPMSKADRFTCTEYVLPVHPRLYVVGKHNAGTIGPPNWTSLILSKKSREQLMGSTAKAAKFSLIGGGAAATAGVALALIGHFTAPAKPAPTPATAPAAAVTAPADPTPAAAEEAPAEEAPAPAAKHTKKHSGRRH
jgi:E3 Ubiquitin ligase